MNLRQLPNVITIARMLMVPPLLWCLHTGDHIAALWIALTAGVSDALDGWLAKRYGWQTWLGGVLDPIADKLLLDASFVGLWLAAVPGCASGSALPMVAGCAGATSAVPGWLAALVVGRDVVIVAGASAYHFLVGPVVGRPTRLSKATTVVQIGFVLVSLVELVWRPLPSDLSMAALALVAALTFGSGIDYVVRWGLRARNASRARHG